MSPLSVGPPDFTPKLIVFDKDGTLIDFHLMWAGWVTTLAQRLERATGMKLDTPLFQVMGYDAVSARVLPTGPLAAHSMAALRQLTLELVRTAGSTGRDAERIVNKTWYVPDPVALARPLGNLPHLFSSLDSMGIATAVATSDDHAPAAATLAAMGILPFLDALVAADDNVPHKPAPDMILHLCRVLDVSPSQTLMVGDAIADMQMGRAAGARLVVGVSSGVSPAELLAPYADLIIGSVDDLLAD